MSAFWTRRRLILAVVLLGALLRLWAAWQLPWDADEPVYLQAAYDYAHLIRGGDWNGIIDYSQNQEHPPLVKLLYSMMVLSQGERPSWEGSLFAGRAISVLFGTLSVWLIALVNPLAGLLLAVQTMVVKYTSEVYLEAAPLFFSLAAVFSFSRSQAARDRWFWISALALGLVAAGKYSYLPVVVVILYLFFWEKRYAWQNLLAYLAVATLTFLAFNPALWHDPSGRLLASMMFHSQYSTSAHVQLSGYPWYQPFVWVSRSMPYQWHPQVFFYFGFDGLIALLAVVGLRWEWRERRWVVVWIAGGMLFLLLWPTKWPHYTLLVLPAICLSSAAGTTRLYQRIKEEEAYWNWFSEMIPQPSKTWVILSIALITLVTLGQVTQTVREALNRQGWWHLTPENTALASKTVYQVLAGPERQMIAGSERGALIFSLSEDTTLPEDWEVFNTANSGLAGNRVLAVAQEADGGLWFGTQSGLSRYAAGRWQTFRGADYGLPGDQVQALEFGRDGRLWVGTNAGIAVYNGTDWQSFTSKSSGLVDDFILSLAVDSSPSGEVVWAGTRNGLSRFEPATGEWTSFTAENSPFDRGGIADLLLDTQGRLWAASLGSGLGVWDGEFWTAYRVSNSEIPSNTVEAIAEAKPGIYWVATAIPTEVGGVLARFDGQDWQVYTAGNSGFSGAEPLSITLDEEGRLWIGTRTAGVDIFEPR